MKDVKDATLCLNTKIVSLIKVRIIRRKYYTVHTSTGDPRRGPQQSYVAGANMSNQKAGLQCMSFVPERRGIVLREE